MLELGFVSLCYLWFVLAIENALPYFTVLLKRNFLFKAGRRIVQKIILIYSQVNCYE